MTKQLRYWRDLPQQKRNELKTQHAIKVVTFEFICRLFENKL